MTKPVVTDHRYDFRGGRNTAISSDLLNSNELVDCTNVRLDSTFGGFTKRTGSQRLHNIVFPAKIDAATQWDAPVGKQTVVISNGKLWWRNGFDLSTAFTSVTPVQTLRTSLNQGNPAGWVGSSYNTTRTTAGTTLTNQALICKLGDPAINNNIIASDGNYTLGGLTITTDGTGLTGTYASTRTTATFSYSVDGGVTWTPITPNGGNLNVGAVLGEIQTTTFTSIVFGFGTGFAPAQLWISVNYSLYLTGLFSGTTSGTISVSNGVPNYPFTWASAGGALNGAATWAPFRANSSGAPLVLFFSNNGHLWKWDGNNPGVLTQIDPTGSLTPSGIVGVIASYHTRMFVSGSLAFLPKTVFWSKIGDATNYTTGDKTMGGSALTDFLSGNALIAMELIGSSLLLATTEAIMRFTGHASDDIVIAQDTEGISTEVGVIGPQAMKRYENVCAFMSNRGPYTATETYVQPMGEALNPDWLALDNVNLGSCVIEYHRGRKELWFAVPRKSDGGVNKTIFVYSTRLQAWQGPWNYTFGIQCMAKYVDGSGGHKIIAGGTDGYLRLMDTDDTLRIALDDVLYDGTGGTNVSMKVELPVVHFGIPALKKALRWILLQADIPTGSLPNYNVSFDGAAFGAFPFIPSDVPTRDYRVEVAGDNSQGFRPRIQFTDTSKYMPTVFGMSIIAWNYERTT